jgi:hypothetical protein
MDSELPRVKTICGLAETAAASATGTCNTIVARNRADAQALAVVRGLCGDGFMAKTF